MRKSRGVTFSGWPSWRYGPNGEAQIFQKEEDVPEGWGRKPGETGPVFTPPPAPIVLDKEDLLQRLESKGIEINYAWSSAHMKKVLDDISSTR